MEHDVVPFLPLLPGLYKVQDAREDNDLDVELVKPVVIVYKTSELPMPVKASSTMPTSTSRTKKH